MAMELSFDFDSHTYTVGELQLASVTEVIRSVGLVRDRGYASEYDMWLGSASHKAIELYLKGNLDYESLDPRLLPRLKAFQEFEQVTGFKAEVIEKPVYSALYMVAGTPDIIGSFPNGNKAIIDEKNGAIIKATAIQLELYRIIAGLPDSTRRFGLQLTDDGRSRMIEFTDEDDAVAAYSAINLFNWIRKKGGRRK